MGKAQKKTGKGRIDKYYKLAKEQGYRARSAFKLIQLNKKYSFLESSKCLIDLCAAPGGWLQVASKHMPVNSLIVGVDLVPIKPIPGVSTFAADITSSNCRNLIRQELKDWKADVVLHDGAPNVGTAWVQDAYAQSELVLMSLKLAVEFLVKGGTFVTKVFRSADYNNLLWVLNQLFEKAEATKPPSSRNVSAEIFVVCSGFRAPKTIDPKFLDPKHVFRDLAALPSSSTSAVVAKQNAHANVYQAEKKKRHRDGYADGDYILFQRSNVSDFVKSSDPVSFLGGVNQLVFETDEEKRWLSLETTTLDIKESLNDLKVLGKGDFKALIRWRTAIREEDGLDVKVNKAEPSTEIVETQEQVVDDEDFPAQLEQFNAEAAAKLKRERRKANEKRTRATQRMQLRMTAPTDIGLELTDAALGGQADVFDLETAKKGLNKRRRVGELPDGDEDDSSQESSDDNSDEEEPGEARLTSELDALYDVYKARKDAKLKTEYAKMKQKEEASQWHGFKASSVDGDGSDQEVSGDGWNRLLEAKNAEDSDSSSDWDSDAEQTAKSKHKPNDSQKQRTRAEINGVESGRSQVWFGQEIFTAMGDLEDAQDELDNRKEDVDRSPTPESSNVAMISSANIGFDALPENFSGDEDLRIADGMDEDTERALPIRKKGLLTAEAVTLAHELVNREKSRSQLVDDGFNRYSFDSKDDLPTWFLDDEAKHFRANLPITKEAVAVLRAKERMLDARPIKKIAEAKARKKFRATRQAEKAIKKAEEITGTKDVTEREKAKSIEKLMNKQLFKGAKRPKPTTVVAKGSHKGLKGRPKGVKGRYVMVDARMKKEVRAAKRRDRRK